MGVGEVGMEGSHRGGLLPSAGGGTANNYVLMHWATTGVPVDRRHRWGSVQRRKQVYTRAGGWATEHRPANSGGLSTARLTDWCWPSSATEVWLGAAMLAGSAWQALPMGLRAGPEGVRASSWFGDIRGVLD